MWNFLSTIVEFRESIVFLNESSILCERKPVWLICHRKRVSVGGRREEGDDGGQAQSRRRYFWARLSHFTHPTLALKNASPRIVFAASFSTLVESDKGGITRAGKLQVRVSCALFPGLQIIVVHQKDAEGANSTVDLVCLVGSRKGSCLFSNFEFEAITWCRK